MEQGRQSTLSPEVTKLGLSFSYGNYDTLYEGTQVVDSVSDEKIEVFTTTLSLRHNFGKGVSAGISLPVGMLHYTYKDAVNEVNRRISGLGDLTLSARYELGALWALQGYRPSVLAHFSLGLPSGTSLATVDQSSEGPSAPSTAPPTLLGLGMGTYAGTLGLDITQYVHSVVALRIPLWARVPFHENTDRVFYGKRFGYGLGVLIVPTSWLMFAGEVNGRFATRSEHGDKGEVQKSGGHWLAAELHAAFRLSKRISFLVRGRLPIAAKTNGRQLVESFSVGTALSITFSEESDNLEDEARLD